jgi:hypothetical protein
MAGPGEAGLLPIQRQVVHEIGDQQVGQQPDGGDALVDRVSAHRWLHDALAALAGHLGQHFVLHNVGHHHDAGGAAELLQMPKLPWLHAEIVHLVDARIYRDHDFQCWPSRMWRSMSALFISGRCLLDGKSRGCHEPPGGTQRLARPPRKTTAGAATWYPIRPVD